MKFRENDIIVSVVDISPIIRKGTKGVILSILEEDKVFQQNNLLMKKEIRQEMEWKRSMPIK